MALLHDPTRCSVCNDCEFTYVSLGADEAGMSKGQKPVKQ